MTALDTFDINADKKHDKNGADTSTSRATSHVSMTKSDKERLTAVAKAHGLSLSAFFRLAADEYTQITIGNKEEFIYGKL